MILTWLRGEEVTETVGLCLINSNFCILAQFDGNPLQYSCLENPMEEPCRLQSMGLQSQTRLNDFTSILESDPGYNLKKKKKHGEMG